MFRFSGICWFIGWLDFTASKFYDWRERYGKVNEHNGWVPRRRSLRGLYTSGLQATLSLKGNELAIFADCFLHQRTEGGVCFCSCSLFVLE